MILDLVLLEIYKLNKFSGPIPNILCFTYSHVLTDGSMLHYLTKYCLQMVVSVLFGHLSNCKKWFSLVVGYLDVLFYLYIARELLQIIPQNTVHCCWSFHFVFCQKSTDRPLWTFSFVGLITSVLAVDLPVFRLPLWGKSSTDPVFKNLLTNHSKDGLFKGLSCLRSKSKCFTNFIGVSEIDFVLA